MFSEAAPETMIVVIAWARRTEIRRKETNQWQCRTSILSLVCSSSGCIIVPFLLPISADFQRVILGEKKTSTKLKGKAW